MAKGWWNVCCNKEGEEEKVEDNSDLDPYYKDDYGHGDNWDPEELSVNSNKEEEESNDAEENIYGYTTNECTYLHHIDNLEAASDINNDDEAYNNNDDEGEKGKDERYYLREERALKPVEVITKLRKKHKRATINASFKTGRTEMLEKG